MRQTMNAIEVSRLQGRGGFRQVGRQTATTLVDRAVIEVLGPAAVPHLNVITAAIAKPHEPVAQKYLRRFKIDGETLAQIEAVIRRGYTNVLSARDQRDATFSS
jgi:hypothetical protein